MRLFQGCFFVIGLVFSRKCGLFIRWSHWFGWYLTSSWIRWFIRQCFQRVIWGRGFRQNYKSIMCHTDTFFFPRCIHTDTFFLHHCIIMTECVFQLFLRTVYHLHHIIKLWMPIFVRVKLTSQRTIGFFHIILCWRLIQTKNIIIQFINLRFLRVLNNSLNK